MINVIVTLRAAVRRMRHREGARRGGTPRHERIHKRPGILARLVEFVRRLLG